MPIIVSYFSADATRPTEACYDRLFAAGKSARLKKVKYSGLTPWEAAGVRSND